MQEILGFSAIIRNGTPVSLASAKNLPFEYKGLFRKTKERSMMKARVYPINFTNTEVCVEMWKS